MENKTPNYEKAIPYLDKACAKGGAEGCLFLGAIYQYGMGVKIDLKKGSNFYWKACSKDEALGCQFLGDMYINETKLQDEFKALSFYDRGCKLNDELSCIRFNTIKNNLDKD